MPKLFYVARDSSGKKVVGSEEVASQDDLIAHLQAKGLIVVSILPEDKYSKIPVAKQPKEEKSKARKMHGSVTEADLVVFCRQLSTLLGAGVTILKSIEIIIKQVGSRKLQSVLQTMIKDMEAGLSLHEAMGKHQKVFSQLWVNLVESGEASGNLAVVLNRLASYLERNSEFKKKIISALIYPAILFLAGMGALLFITFKIIPTFSALFQSFKVKMPPLTLALMIFSDLVRKYSLALIIVSAVVFFFIRKYIQTKQGRKAYEQIMLNLPVIGDFFHAVAVEKFSSEMSTLIESGVPILYSLEIAEHSVGSVILSEIIHKIKDNVREGRPLSQQLEKSGFFEPMVVQMVAVGEEIGELSSMFKKINEFYEDYVETFLTRITAMFEPIMLIFMGLIIGIMIMGMFLPIFQIAKMGS